MFIYKDLINGNYRTRAEYLYDKCHLGNNAKPVFESEFKKFREIKYIVRKGIVMTEDNFQKAFTQIVKNDIRIWVTAVSTLLWGLFAHDYVMFNKFSFDDDNMEFFSIGATWPSG